MLLSMTNLPAQLWLCMILVTQFTLRRSVGSAGNATTGTKLLGTWRIASTQSGAGFISSVPCFNSPAVCLRETDDNVSVLVLTSFQKRKRAETPTSSQDSLSLTQGWVSDASRARTPHSTYPYRGEPLIALL